MTDLNKLADELEGLAKGATPGQWVVREGANSHVFEGRLSPAADEDATIAFVDLDGPDTALIVALRNRLPTILSALRSAGKMREALEPFAMAASVLEKVNRSIKDSDLINVEMSDLRRARAALKTEGE